MLLSNGTVINLVDGTRLSPFFVACYDRLDYSVGPLLLIRANINMCSKNWASPLYKACQNGQFSTVKILLINEDDIIVCMKGETALFMERVMIDIIAVNRFLKWRIVGGEEMQ